MNEPTRICEILIVVFVYMSLTQSDRPATVACIMNKSSVCKRFLWLALELVGLVQEFIGHGVKVRLS